MTDEVVELEHALNTFSLGMPTLKRDLRRPADVSIAVSTPEQARAVLCTKLGEAEVDWVQRRDPDFAPVHPLPANDPVEYWSALIDLVNDRHTLDQNAPINNATPCAIRVPSPDEQLWRLIRQDAAMPRLDVCAKKRARSFVFHAPVGLSAGGVAVGLANERNKGNRRWLVYRALLDSQAAASWCVFPLRLRDLPLRSVVYDRTVVLLYVDHCVVIRDILQSPAADGNVFGVRLPGVAVAVASMTASSSYLVLVYTDGVFAVVDFDNNGEFVLLQPQRESPPQPPAENTQRNPCNPALELEAPAPAENLDAFAYEPQHHAVLATFDDLDPLRLAVAARDGVVLYGSLPPPGSGASALTDAIGHWQMAAMGETPSLLQQQRYPTREPPLSMVLRGSSLACCGKNAAYRALDLIGWQDPSVPLPRYPCYAAQGDSPATIASVACCGTLLVLYLSDNTIQLCSLAPSLLSPTGSWLSHALKAPAGVPSPKAPYRAFCLTIARMYVLLPDGGVVFVRPDAYGRKQTLTTDTPASVDN